jgi:hypothetical protein
MISDEKSIPKSYDDPSFNLTGLKRAFKQRPPGSVAHSQFRMCVKTTTVKGLLEHVSFQYMRQTVSLRTRAAILGQFALN